MADRLYTIRDVLKNIGVELNIPPFMQGREQLSAEEVKEGRSISSLRIHVERAIGRMKTFSILKGVLPLSLSWVSNQIVCICAWLTNFHPALVPPPLSTDEDVEEYFNNLSDDESVYNGDDDYDYDD